MSWKYLQDVKMNKFNIVELVFLQIIENNRYVEEASRKHNQASILFSMLQIQRDNLTVWPFYFITFSDNIIIIICVLIFTELKILTELGLISVFFLLLLLFNKYILHQLNSMSFVVPQKWQTNLMETVCQMLEPVVLSGEIRRMKPI